MRWPIVLLVLAFIALNVWLPEPFMDERFHVGQTLRYWRGDFGWDPMITTPPGLYLFGYSLLALFRGRWPVTVLRLVSLVHAIGLESLLPQTTMLPIIFPYCLLYYTDVPSLYWLLLARRLLQLDRKWWAAAAGLLSISLRQTNIVWLLHSHILSTAGRDLVMHPLVILYAGFGGFLWWNGGVALGDRSNHAACFHPAQLLYWLTLMLLLFPRFMERFPRLLQKSSWLKLKRSSWLNLERSSWLRSTVPLDRYSSAVISGGIWLISILVTDVILAVGSHEHTYLKHLDPAHLTSWWWTQLHPTAACWILLYAMAIRQQTTLWPLLPPLMLTAGLSPLVEPRYFIVPTVLAMKQDLLQPRRWWIPLNGLLLYLLLNRQIIY